MEPPCNTRIAEERRNAQIAFARALEAVLAAAERDPAAGDKSSLAWLWRQKPVALDPRRGLELLFDSNADAARARSAEGLIRVENKLRELGLAPCISCKVIRPEPRATNAATEARAQAPWVRKIVYLPSFLACTTLPHREPPKADFSRRNGHTVVSLHAPAHIGLPFGVYARLIMIHLTTAAVRTGHDRFPVGRSLRELFGWMGIGDSGGPRGPLALAGRQVDRICATTITTTHFKGTSGVNIPIVDEWLTRDGQGLTVTLSDRFYSMLRQSAIPLDETVVRTLRRSPMALDAYAWLTYRMHTLQEPCRVPWISLESQFGSEYARSRDFRRRFLAAVDAVKRAWPGLELVEHAHALQLNPSPPSVPPRTQRELLREWLTEQ